jgi:hypothetical protein
MRASTPPDARIFDFVMDYYLPGRISISTEGASRHGIITFLRAGLIEHSLALHLYYYLPLIAWSV